MSTTTIPAAFAALLAAATLGAPALAQNDGGLIGDIVSVEPEPQEDCEALRESLESQSENGILNAQHRRELRDKGC